MVWRLEEHIARLETNSIRASFNSEEPYASLALLDSKGESRGRLFSFLLSESPVETYVRGDDLVCKFPPRNSDLVSYTTYHRIADNGESIEFVLSAQTSLLDSAPLTKVTCEFANASTFFKLPSSDDLQQLHGVDRELSLDEAPLFVLIRPNDDESYSWVIPIHPTDFHLGTVRLESVAAAEFCVFPDALEKGVIRRATMKFSRVKREQDEVTAQTLYDRLSTAAPPLTT